MSWVMTCDGPDCDAWTGDEDMFITIADSALSEEMHFCYWDCLLRYAANMPPMEKLEEPL